MKKLLITAALLSLSCLAQAGNYATCLLDKLPGVQNQAATSAAIRMCQTDHPGGMVKVPQGDSRGFFASFRSGSECTLEKSKDTRFVPAAQLISSACHRLYDAPPKPIKPTRLFDDLKPSPTISATEEQISREQELHFAKIYSAHPDASDVAGSQKFKSWVAAQPSHLRTAYENVISSGTADQVIAMLNDFKSSQSPSVIVNQAARSGPQYPDCVFRQTMTDADYEACGIRPPGKQ
ncbi:hypothetical protein NDO41_16255 [Ectopseudomonas mendocina]|nr:hypothetical protein NDO41_16255 [Pseudomonas mendocina]